MTQLKEHLVSRHLNLNLYPNLVLSEEDNVATFPLWNLNGQLVGFQQYKPNQPKNDSSLNPRDLRYFTYLAKGDRNNQSLSAFGLEVLNKDKKVLFVCEGVFDAVRLHNLGLNCLALLCCDPKQLKGWLWSMGYLVVPVCEGDSAGQKMAKLTNCNEVVHLPDTKDLGDLTDEEVLDYFSKYL